MAKRSKSKKKRKASSRKKTRSNHILLKWFIGLLMIALLGVGAYSLYLSKTVRVQFEGKRWAVPARVYARPLELYVGAEISAKQLAHELNTLGYRKVRHPKQTGQWSTNGTRFLIRTRPFQFWDEDTPAVYLEVTTSGDSIEGLRNAKNRQSLDIWRLEPALIGSIYPTHKEDRVLVRHQDLPRELVQALVAVEDRHFFDHHGVDIRGLARALLANIRAGKTVQGGSTLTQQLVKNFFLTPERSLERKFKEMLMALILESRYEKSEILEAYANEIFLGQDGERAIHGFGLASYFYFNRPLKELRLNEVALLVGLVKGASYYNPRRHPERARQRRNLVLKQMAELGYIQASQADKAMAASLGVSRAGRRTSSSYPAFIDLVRRQLRRDYREEDLTSEGLQIHTTLDPWHQLQSEQQIKSELKRIEKAKGYVAGTLQGAVVLVSPQGGEVTALVGDRKAGHSGFNRALDAVRPIGSLVKPAVYLAALGQPERYNLLTLLDDSSVELKGQNGKVWKPRNFDRKEHGEVPLHQALANSYNLATVKLGMVVGLDKVILTLEKLGVSRHMNAYPSLLLGALSLSPMEVAQLYQTFAAGGFRSPLRAIREVLDSDSKPLQRYPLTVSEAAKAGPVYLLNRNLVEVVRSGTAKSLSSYMPAGMEAAGKTGTTNDLRDSWFAGFTGDLVGVVWIGRDDNKPAGLTGSTGSLPVWGKIMQAIGFRSLALVPPDSVRGYWVDKQGLLSAEHCKGAIVYPFISGYEPREKGSCHKEGGLGDFIRGLFE